MKNIIKNNKKYIIIGIIGIIVGIVSYFSLNKQNKKVDIVYKEPLTLEIGEDINTLVSIKDENLIINTKVLNLEDKEVENIELDTEYKLSVLVSDINGKELFKEVKDGLKVVDTTKPVITLKEKEIKVDLLQKFDVDVKVEDNSREVIRPDIDLSKVEYNKNGEYEVYITAKDKSGNEAKETLKVIVNGDESKLTAKAIEEFTTTTGITIVNLPDINVSAGGNANVSAGNKNAVVSNQNNINKQTVNNNNTNTANVKSQDQIAKEQAQAQQNEVNRKIKECKDQWGRWTGSECVWDQPAEPKQDTSVVAQPQPEQPQQSTRDDGCSVSKKLAEYEAYAKAYNDERGGGYAWQHTYSAESGQLRMSIHGGDGRGIPETRREFYCHQQ